MMQTFLMVACGLLAGALSLLMAAVTGSLSEEQKHLTSGGETVKTAKIFSAVVSGASFIASAALLIFARG